MFVKPLSRAHLYTVIKCRYYKHNKKVKQKNLKKLHEVAQNKIWA